MKIGQPSDKQLPNSTVQAALVKSSQGEKRAGETPKAGVAVTVSSLARALSAPSLGDAPDVNLDKVQAMKAAISSRQFSVNPDAIADKLLSNAQEMLSRQRA